MKRRWVLLVVLGLTFAMAAPAGGNGKPDCDIDDSHPSCAPTEPVGGSSCENAVLDGRWDSADAFTAPSDPFLLDWDTNYKQWCIDVRNVQGGNWLIDVDVDGTLRRLLIVLRDSVAPGDACPDGVVEASKVTGTANHYDLIGMPASGPEACGMEFVDDPDDPEPFAFLVFAWAHAKSEPDVTMTVDVPPQKGT